VACVSRKPPATKAEVAAALARVREDVRKRPPSRGPGAEAARNARLAARDQAELYWAVTGERPFLRRPGTAGRLRAIVLAPVKALVRRLVRWYVEPALAEQRHFNSAMLRLLDDLDERTAALEANQRRPPAGDQQV
jgi:hypothetical protein